MGLGYCLVETADLQAAGGSITIDASVTFTHPDGLDQVRNCTMVSDPIKGDLSIKKEIVKTDDPIVVFQLTPTLTGGPINAPQLTIIEELPAGMTIMGLFSNDWTCNPTAGTGAMAVTCTYNASYPVAAGTLDPIYIEVLDKGAKEPNCARVIHETIDEGFDDSDLSNDTGCVTTPIIGKPIKETGNIDLIKRVSDPVAGNGVPIGFQTPVITTPPSSINYLVTVTCADGAGAQILRTHSFPSVGGGFVTRPALGLAK